MLRNDDSIAKQAVMLHIFCKRLQNECIVLCICSVLVFREVTLCVFTALLSGPCWHPGLTKKLSKDIERVQKRCLKLLYPSTSYPEALIRSGLDRLRPP